jgi:hypothetical protein
VGEASTDATRVASDCRAVLWRRFGRIFQKPLEAEANPGDPWAAAAAASLGDLEGWA